MTVVVDVVVVEVVLVVVVVVDVVVVVVVGVKLSKCSVMSRLLQSSSPHQQTVQLVAVSTVHSGVSSCSRPSPGSPQPLAQPPVTSDNGQHIIACHHRNIIILQMLGRGGVILHCILHFNNF